MYCIVVYTDFTMPQAHQTKLTTRTFIAQFVTIKKAIRRLLGANLNRRAINRINACVQKIAENKSVFVHK